MSPPEPQDPIGPSLRGSSGLAMGLLSAAAFGTSGALAKSLLEAGWSPGAAVTARITGAAALLAVPALFELRGRWSTVRASLGLVLVYGLVAIAGVQLFYFNAVQTLSVGVALLLEYLGLVLVVGWVWFRGRRPGVWTWVGVGSAVAGLLLVLDVVGGVTVDAVGVLWGLGAAIGVAVYFVLSSTDSTGLPPLAMAAGGMTVGALGLWVAAGLGVLPMRAPAADVRLGGVDVPWFVPLVLLGLLSTALAYATGIVAARRLGPKVAAFLGLTEVLFAVAFAWVLLDELPLPIQLAGGVLIVAGVAAVRYDELDDPALQPAAGEVPVEPHG
jgi:drug/metabolite transporter (DMT)-like permease